MAKDEEISLQFICEHRIPLTYIFFIFRVPETILHYAVCAISPLLKHEISERRARFENDIAATNVVKCNSGTSHRLVYLATSILSSFRALAEDNSTNPKLHSIIVVSSFLNDSSTLQINSCNIYLWKYFIQIYYFHKYTKF